MNITVKTDPVVIAAKRVAYRELIIDMFAWRDEVDSVNALETDPDLKKVYSATGAAYEDVIKHLSKILED